MQLRNLYSFFMQFGGRWWIRITLIRVCSCRRRVSLWRRLVRAVIRGAGWPFGTINRIGRWAFMLFRVAFWKLRMWTLLLKSMCCFRCFKTDFCRPFPWGTCILRGRSFWIQGWTWHTVPLPVQSESHGPCKTLISFRFMPVASIGQ